MLPMAVDGSSLGVTADHGLFAALEDPTGHNLIDFDELSGLPLLDAQVRMDVVARLQNICYNPCLPVIVHGVQFVLQSIRGSVLLAIHRSCMHARTHAHTPVPFDNQ